MESVDDGFTGDGFFDVPKIRKNITAMTAMAATMMPNVIIDFFSFFFFSASAGSGSDAVSASASSEGCISVDRTLPVKTIAS